MSIFPTRILLATDGSEQAELAALRAVDLADATDSELHVVHVGVVPSFLVSYPGTLGYYGKLYEQIEEMSKELLRKQSLWVKAAGGTVAGSHLRLGQVALEIVALAEELGVGLIVMGSRGLGGVRRALMGSVSDSVVRHAHCPVLVVRPKKGQAALASPELPRVFSSTSLGGIGPLRVSKHTWCASGLRRGVGLSSLPRSLVGSHHEVVPGRDGKYHEDATRSGNSVDAGN